MKICYDSHIFSYHKYGGISRYFVELVKQLSVNNTCVLELHFTDNIYIKSLEYNNIISKTHSLPFNRGKSKIYEYLNRFSDIKSLRKEYDIFHPTYYTPYFLKYVKSPYVITVHDMIHEKYNRTTLNEQFLLEKKKTIIQANRIIAVSENTKQDLMDLYDIPSEKIDVVYHGYSIADYEKEVPMISSDFILYVGDRNGYKNWKKFIEAFAIIHRLFPELSLVCTGKPFSVEEYSYLDKHNLTSSVHSVFASESQLAWLYRHAICFVYPSLYEGFGIPILESFATNCPCVLSNTSCFPEIAREGGLYFDPYDIDAMADTITKVVDSSELRKNLILKGNKRLQNFSWKKTAQKTLEVYRSTILL